MSKKHYWGEKIFDFTLQGVGRESFEVAVFLLQYTMLMFFWVQLVKYSLPSP